MARPRDPEDKKERRRPERRTDQERENEEELEEQKKKEPEHESSRMQNQYGNQGVQAIIQAQGGDLKGGGGGVEVEMARRKKAHEKEGQDYGGEDEPADEGAITETDLAAGWNLGTTQPSDRAKHAGGLLGEELPPEDEAWLASVTRDVVGSQDWTIDTLLQPSMDALAGFTAGWLRGIARLTNVSPGMRARGSLATRGAPLLQDPHGRLVLGRARTAALGSLSLLGVPLGFNEDVNRAVLVNLALELEAREPALRAAAVAHGDKAELPTSAGLFQVLCPDPADALPIEEPTPSARAVVEAAFHAMIHFPDPTTLVPRLPEIPVDEDDPEDEFGLDAVLQELTGGRPDRAEPVYRAATQTAEKIAASSAWLRARMASLAALIVATVQPLGGANPRGTLDPVVKQVDADTQLALQICLEVARASNRRALAPPALHNGLKRAAAQVVKAYRAAVAGCARVAAAMVPGNPQVAPLPPVPPDPLAEAWHDGDPLGATEWLASLPPSLDREAALTFTRLAVLSDPEAAVVELDRLLDVARPDAALSYAARIVLGGALLWDGQPERALQIAEHHQLTAEPRRNGVLYVEAVLLGVEALRMLDRADEAEALRVSAAKKLASWGARGPLSLLARWSPPDTDA